MKKQKVNDFLDKFNLLNSQEHTEDIKWSSSSSSDYENTSCYEVHAKKNSTRKRKRKKTARKNTSNLDITIIETSKDAVKASYREKSPILSTKCVNVPTSPILMTSRLPPNKSISPILKQKSFHVKSPVLKLKSASPRSSLKVKKNLSFNVDTKESCFHRNESNLNSITKDKKSNVKNEDNPLIFKTVNSSVNSSTCSTDSTANSKELIEKHYLINKVKNYFQSHFSSENSSQNISDTQSPEECKNEDVDILTCKTVVNMQLVKHESTNSDCSTYFETNSKKVKYKKGGLASRLNVLLKKQLANISLWHHERFLAVNSNFVVSKGEFILFCVENIVLKYGCYMVNVIDVKNEKYIIVVNSFYVNNNIFFNSILRLYEPYKIITMDSDLKLIVNVIKFECIEIKSNLNDH